MESQYIQINFASEVVEKRIHHRFWPLCILLLIHKKVRPVSIIYTIYNHRFTASHEDMGQSHYELVLRNSTTV